MTLVGDPETDVTGDDPFAVDLSASYLLARLGLLETRVKAVVERRRSGDPAPDDPFRGLYVTDEQVDDMLNRGPVSKVIAWDDGGQLAALEARATDLEMAGRDIRLRSLADRAGLSSFDIELLLVALAPDLDPRFERLYGYLNDDVSRRRASVGLAIELAGASTWSGAARYSLGPRGPLVASALVAIDDPERPFLSRAVKVPDRVAAHLLGDDTPDPTLVHLMAAAARWQGGSAVEGLGSALKSGVGFVYLRERAGASAPSMAAAALEAAGLGAVAIDLRKLDTSDDPVQVLRTARREALLRGAGLVAGPIDALVERPGSTISSLTAGFEESGATLILHGRISWEPAWSLHIPLMEEANSHSTGDRTLMWRDSLGVDAPEDFSDSDVAVQFVLSSDGVDRAVQSARLQAKLGDGQLSYDHLRFGARVQNGAGLERLARRIQPHVGFEDLVLFDATASALRELTSRARRRQKVLDEWGMRPGGGRGRGITVLFAGDSGTGKTMSAEVVAGDLGLDLYTVNLATVVDKYVGETEKNLERIFVEADGVNAVLLFDEADALFGKRSEVKDANDRYANIEVAYLLQRMETFDGIAILSTNLSANVDDAFSRRLDMIIDFPTPDREKRLTLWERCLGPTLPRAGDLDLEFCSSFDLSGGNIRSIAISAAYSAAESGQPLNMHQLIRAIGREYRKLGRLIVPGEFGPYFDLAAGI